MPMEDNLLRRMVWEIVSKAALRSRRMRMDSKPESAAMGSMHASRTFTTMPNNTAHLLPVYFLVTVSETCKHRLQQRTSTK